MFTIPFDYEYETRDIRLLREECLKFIHENLDWIQIVPHGLTHMPSEFLNCDKDTMKKVLVAIDEAFKKDNLPYVKGFKAPYWQWNQEVVDVLDKKGWWGGINPNDKNMIKTKKYYEYKYSIDEPFWRSKDPVVKIHGHMTPPSANNIDDCFLNLFKIPNDCEFDFVTDHLCE